MAKAKAKIKMNEIKYSTRKDACYLYDLDYHMRHGAHTVYEWGIVRKLKIKPQDPIITEIKNG